MTLPPFDPPSTFCLPFIFPPNYNVDDNTCSKGKPLDRTQGGQLKFGPAEFDKLEEQIKALSAEKKSRSKRVVTELINDIVRANYEDNPAKRAKLNQLRPLDPKTMTKIRNAIPGTWKARK